MAHPDAAPSTSTQPAPSWTDEIGTLFTRAAELAVAHGIDSEAFLQAAWSAYLEARPGLREELEDKELQAHLKRLRKRGLVGLA